ncbi:Bifunctional protein BirA [Piscirickettsia salmonis]|uniref:biotin--[acetyl-CoA-carboxylase] ligase n=1 Tax=Piscirickettsia salmonis TaxID=1238 RepID=UPI0012BB179F|nr:biotin--[acetyl-CoA-carboxylase] ligase [Piscirickettsia salmonis]QGP56390.1 Bifunctional protein BirA [Piscirickettsia salmonis]QGP57746.1 Bifunctional protein BirA [Piscirickettsia salmonis]QGP65953.1 Bifunctional protein BirA [Piscirickettsia salmonis]
MKKLGAILELVADGQFHSGEDLGAVLGVSRAAVWKQLKQLKELGLEIESVPGRGYCLSQPLHLLDAHKITEQLSGQARRQLSHIQVLSVTDSTNNVLLNQLQQGNRQAQACFAELQTAGRGRRGRAHHAGINSCLMGSVAWVFQAGMFDFSVISLVVGICMARSLTKLGCAHVELKWPNDLQYAGRKLGGVLVESSVQEFSYCHAVIGLFVNVALSAQDRACIDQPCVDIKEIIALSKTDLSRNQLAAAILNELCAAFNQLTEKGFDQFLTEWQHYDALCGREVIVRLNHEAVTGIAQGIDGVGRLLVKTSQGLRSFSYGEVSVRTL